MKICIIVSIILAVNFSIHSMQLKYNDNKKHMKETELVTEARISLFLGNLDLDRQFMNNVMLWCVLSTIFVMDSQ